MNLDFLLRLTNYVNIGIGTNLFSCN